MVGIAHVSEGGSRFHQPVGLSVDVAVVHGRDSEAELVGADHGVGFAGGGVGHAAGGRLVHGWILESGCVTNSCASYCCANPVVSLFFFVKQMTGIVIGINIVNNRICQ